eukprot:scaffold90559_cov28-Tisochrysis_lutea.AAC.1
MQVCVLRLKLKCFEKERLRTCNLAPSIGLATTLAEDHDAFTRRPLIEGDDGLYAGHIAGCRGRDGRRSRLSSFLWFVRCKPRKRLRVGARNGGNGSPDWLFGLVGVLLCHCYLSRANMKTGWEPQWLGNLARHFGHLRPELVAGTGISGERSIGIYAHRRGAHRSRLQPCEQRCGHLVPNAELGNSARLELRQHKLVARRAPSIQLETDRF